MTLEDLQPNAAIRGILPDALVTVVGVQWFGSEALELTYKTPAGKVANELLYRHDQPRLNVEHGRPWSFDGDGSLFRLVSEAQRIRLAHLFDPVLAVHTSVVEPLPHQITAVYESMLPRQINFMVLSTSRATAVTIEYQRDSSSKRPRSSVASAARAPTRWVAKRKSAGVLTAERDGGGLTKGHSFDQELQIPRRRVDPIAGTPVGRQRLRGLCPAWAPQAHSSKLSSIRLNRAQTKRDTMKHMKLTTRMLAATILAAAIVLGLVVGKRLGFVQIDGTVAISK